MRILIVMFWVFALWDMFTTFYGTLSALSGKSLPFVRLITYDATITFTSIGFATIIMLILFATKYVVATGWHIMFRILVGITFIYDVVTSYYGNQTFIIGSHDITAIQFFIIIGLTLVVSGSTIAIPYLMEQKRKRY
jgi:hypothetical protein